MGGEICPTMEFNALLHIYVSESIEYPNYIKERNRLHSKSLSKYC